MHLSQVLSVWKGYRIFQRPRNPKGNIFRGKYRLVKKVTPLDMATLRRDLEIEDRNMFYLRNPYLKFKEYVGVEKHYLKVGEKRLAASLEEKYRKFTKTVEPRSFMSQYKKIMKANDRWE